MERLPQRGPQGPHGSVVTALITDITVSAVMPTSWNVCSKDQDVQFFVIALQQEPLEFWNWHTYLKKKIKYEVISQNPREFPTLNCVSQN